MSTSPLENPPQPLSLPTAPPSAAGPVRAWSEAADLMTSSLPQPNRNPAFGAAYPLPLVEYHGQQVGIRTWQAIHVENEFLRLMILPELGGRIHLALDKSSGREFLYREDTLRVDESVNRYRGGLEIQFPTDPRRLITSPADTYIEEQADGARTVWCSVYDRASGMRGMHGICLYAGRAYVELKVRIFNRTQFAQPFNWSAVAGLPTCAEQLIFFPQHHSRMQEGFSGAYCPIAKLGLLQVTEGRAAAGVESIMGSGYAELRAGMYSGLPPRVSTLAPGESRSFSQFWYPFTAIGPVQNANVDAAISMSLGGSISVGVTVTRPFPNALVLLETEGTTLNRWTADLAPGHPFLNEASLPVEIDPVNVTLKILTSAGRELISSLPSGSREDSATLAQPPIHSLTKPFDSQPPRKVETLEQLYLTGLRVQHQPVAAHSAEEYWSEALRRDPHHAPSNLAIGLLQLRRGEFGEAESRFRAAIETLAAGELDGRDGELFYHLGLTLRFQERDEEAFAAFQRATWDFAWRASSLHAAAELECKRRNFGVVPKYLYESLRLNADNNNARSLAVVLFRRFGRAAEAEHLVRESLTLDPLDPWACHLAGRPLPGDNQTRLDLAFDYARAALFEPAIELLTGADTFARDGSLPMIHYTLAALYMQSGDLHSAHREYQAAAASSPDFCFPHRLEEMMVLARAIALQPEDARAQYHLGCLLYHYGLPLQALEIWQSSTKLNDQFPTVWRNLALGYFNVTGEHEKALDAFDKAFSLDPSDGRVLLERDQLWRRLGVPPTLRFQEIQERKALAARRADLAIELATLYNTHDEPENALSLFSSDILQGWEQSSGDVAEYVRTFVKLGRKALANDDHERARDLFLLALSNHAVSTDGSEGAPRSAELHFWLGEAVSAGGHRTAAETYWQKATVQHDAASTRPAFNEATFFVALALGRIGERQQSRKLLRELWFTGRRIAREHADSVPQTSSIKPDPVRSQRVRGLLLQSQARVGLGQYKLASRLLEQLLTLDPNNARALDLISDLEQVAGANRNLK